MAVKVGTGFVDLKPDLTSFQAAIGSQLAPITGKFGKIGKAAVGGFAAGIAGAAVVGKALYDIGAQFDAAYDRIQTGTGATGQRLEGLKDDFREVVKAVPADFGDAGEAITQLNQRLGITGKPLQALSKQVLELSRITGTDLDTNIQQVTRTFGDWGVKVGQQPAALDKMFRASQATGISVGDLGQQMVRYGAPLRQMGFGFEEAAAMVGKFEKEGVNAQLVMGSLRIALGKMATEGVEDPSKALGILTQQIKNAGSAGEANKLAIETFGARAGPDMAAAIREGRFEFGSLVKEIEGGKNTVIGAGESTMDFGERWKMLKNQVFVALEPIATRVFNAIGDGMVALTQLMRGKGNIAEAFNSIKRDLAPFLPIVRTIFSGIKGVLSGFVQTFKGAFTMIRGVVTVFSGLLRGDFSKMWDGVKMIFSGAVQVVVGSVKRMTAPLRQAAALAAKAVVAGFNFLKGLAGNVAGFLRAAISKLVVAPFRIRAELIAKAVVAAFNIVRQIVGKVAGFMSDVASKIAGFGGKLFSAAKSVGGSVIDGIVAGIRAVVGKVGAVATEIANKLKGPINAVIRAWNAIEFSIPGVDPPGPGPKFPGVTVGTPDIGELASGTRFWRGGPALIGERGPELMDLPRGAAVTGATRTRRILDSIGESKRSAGDTYNFELEVVDGEYPDAGHMWAAFNSRLRAMGARH